MIGAAGLSFAFVERGVRLGGAISPASAASPTTFNSWVTISSDGLISIMSPAAEMGQGSKTSLPLILADELDADWKDVRIVPAPPNEEIYGNPGFLGMMYTAGSATVAGYYAPLRQFGAQVRRVILDNAAQKWGIPVSELRTEPSVVVHDKTDRRLTYGEIASFAVLPSTAPQISSDELKRPGQFRLIGNDVTRFELPTKVDGSARYAIDIQVPRMLYRALLTPVFPDSRAETIDDAAARAVPGVIGIYHLPSGFGVGVVAETPWAAFAAKDVLRVSWTQSAKAGAFDSEASMDRYAAISRGEISQQVTLWDKAGDGADGLKTATETLTGEYRCDYA